jgi:surface polysaccharide O-acyltransferase-like enzyme
VHAWGFAKLNRSDQRGYLMIDLFCYWCVPVFVMLSGSLLLNDAQVRSQEEPHVFFAKRWRRMIRPTIVWATFATIWGTILLKNSREETIERLFTGKPNDPQWFLFMMLGLYSLTPWIRLSLSNPSLRKSQILGLTLLLFAGNVFAFFQHWMGFVTEPKFPIDSLIFLDFYLFGLVAGQREPWSPLVDRSIYATAFVFTLVLLSLAIWDPAIFVGNQTLFWHCHSPFVIVQAIAIFRLAVVNCPDFDDGSNRIRTKVRHGVRILSKWSFGIYVIHPFVLDVLFKFVLRPIDGPFLPYSLFIWSMCMAICCLLCSLLNKSAWSRWMIP